MSDDRRDRDRLGPPPIEPLPDLAWARVERAVLAELDAPETRQVKMPLARWPLYALIGGAVAGAAALAIVIATRDAATPPAPAEALASRVVTGDAPSEVSFGDAHVTVAPGSAVVLGGDAAQGVLAVLERGRADFVVAPRQGRPAFTVQAGAVGVRVIGTEFTVIRTTAEDADVVVAHGVVEVTHHGHRFDIHAGERWSSTPEVTAATDDDIDLDVDDDAVAAKDPPRDRDHDRDRAKAFEDRDPATAQERYEAAARLESTDARAAMAGYRELARGRGAWAGNALYALGRLADERGEHDRARDALRSYVHRFPRGANVADARALLAKLKGASP